MDGSCCLSLSHRHTVHTHTHTHIVEPTHTLCKRTQIHATHTDTLYAHTHRHMYAQTHVHSHINIVHTLARCTHTSACTHAHMQKIDLSRKVNYIYMHTPTYNHITFHTNTTLNLFFQQHILSKCFLSLYNDSNTTEVPQ